MKDYREVDEMEKHGANPKIVFFLVIMAIFSKHHVHVRSMQFYILENQMAPLCVTEHWKVIIHPFKQSKEWPCYEL